MKKILGIFILGTGFVAFSMEINSEYYGSNSEEDHSIVEIDTDSEGKTSIIAVINAVQGGINEETQNIISIAQRRITKHKEDLVSPEESSEDEEAYSEIVKDKTAKYRRNKSKTKRVRSPKGKEIEWLSDESDEEIEAVQKMTRLSEKDKEEIQKRMDAQTVPVPEKNTVTPASSNSIIDTAFQVIGTAALGALCVVGAIAVGVFNNNK